VPDDADRCPVTPEDQDGFEDEDGCPEPDNDRDGVADGKDKCPLEAEVINGNNDDDGCPDLGAGAVTVRGSAVVLNDVVRFRPATSRRATRSACAARAGTRGRITPSTRFRTCSRSSRPIT
jgi:hypothetical protein